jgi:hypothetical protein
MDEEEEYVHIHVVDWEGTEFLVSSDENWYLGCAALFLTYIYPSPMKFLN